MSLHVVDHPLVAHRVAVLRDATTGSAEFRRVTGELAGFLVYEATRALPTRAGAVVTPLGLEAATSTLVDHQPLLVPILRAGLALLEGALTAVPTAEVGLVGLARDEETKQPTPYCVRLPADLGATTALVLDPMLATGGSLAWTCELLAERGVARVAAVCLLAAPPGVELMASRCPDVDIVVAALDPELDERAFIVPGLGDAGDRLYGRV
jgi:uracil phosphoribosyltransferase